MKRSKSGASTVGDQVVVAAGSPIFARPITADWLARNKPQWATPFAEITEVGAVTLAQVRWPGASAPQFGVALWLDDAADLSGEERQALADRVAMAVDELPPKDKVVIIVEGALAALFRAVGAPVFVRDAARFAERVRRAEARDGVHMARDPFTRQ